MKIFLRHSCALIILISILAGCRKDIQPEIDESVNDTTCYENWCEDFGQAVQDGIAFSYDYNEEGVHYTKPFLNPLNQDELICVKETITQGNSERQLIKISLTNKQEVVLCQKLIISQPQWGENGWIIFETIDWRVWKIYDDGSQLQQVTNFESHSPVFTGNNNNFIVMGNGLQLTSWYRPILDLDGNLIDSVKFEYNNIFIGYPYLSIDSNFKSGYFRYSNHNYSPHVSGICQLNENSGISILTTFTENSFGVNMVDMAKNGNKIYFTIYKEGIFELNLLTGGYTKIRNACDSFYYEYLTISKSTGKILVEKVIQKKVDWNLIKSRKEIWELGQEPCEDKLVLGE